MNTFSKLRDGTWGVRLEDSNIEVGDSGIVPVTKKSGETENLNVRVFWSNGEISLGAIIREVVPVSENTDIEDDDDIPF